jgi:predicted RNA methylase
VRARSTEADLLRSAQIIIRNFEGRWPQTERQEARFQLLEAVASRLGGFDLSRYFEEFQTRPILAPNALLAVARDVVAQLDTPIPPAIAVSALAREALNQTDQRTSGAYHTDYRLAMHLAECLKTSLRPGAKVIDPACGAGILLVAASLVACGADRRLTSEWLANSIFATDLSENALRGTQLSLACLTDDLNALRQMRDRWFDGDSLLGGAARWQGIVPNGFDVVVANPPWEKLKVTRHEFIQAEGGDRHYGSDYDLFDEERYAHRKNGAKDYGELLAARYSTLGCGEPDLFVAFSELVLALTKPGGSVGMILPAGLIRSKNTERLRRFIWSETTDLSLDVFENRARFFNIDTRFKFLTVHGRKRTKRVPPTDIELRHSGASQGKIRRGRAVHISRSSLARIRPDLSVPEVRTDPEWLLFIRMVEGGHDWSQSDSPWFPHFVREVDMTRDRRVFHTNRGGKTVALIEGRMVHQHRLGAKAHIWGSGRSAIWRLNCPGESEVRPQFWISPLDLSPPAQQRLGVTRAGFCDITGQTNERSLLAAMIPAGVACGNKVPTILFPNEPSEERLWLWIALANSIPFDWLVRRVITTTVNYFHLLGLPLPAIEPSTLPGRHLIEISKTLADLDRAGFTMENLWKIAHLRAKADKIVAGAYGLTGDDLDLMLEDFPLLDGGQPILAGDDRATLTRDLLRVQSRQSDLAAQSKARLDAAAAIGGVPYVPAQFAKSQQDHRAVLTSGA